MGYEVSQSQKLDIVGLHIGEVSGSIGLTGQRQRQNGAARVD